MAAINALDQHGRLTRLYESPARIGALALTEKGNLIFSQNAGVAILDRTSLRVTQNSKLAITLSSYRFNDGACDPQGRFITGLMDEGHSGNTGKLYRYDAGLNASVMLDGISLPNGLAWTSQGDELLFVDSVARTLYHAPYSANGNALQKLSVFARTPEELGRPDGLALDIEDNLWVCQRRLPAAVRPQWGPVADVVGAGATPHQLLLWRAGYAHLVHYHRQIRHVGDRTRGLSGGG